MPSFGNFLGRSVSEAAGFGAGLAIGPALHPVVQEVVNRTWALHPDRPLSVGEAAAIVAEAVELAPWGIEEARQTGFDEDRFNALLGEVLNAPGIGELFEARRRSLITDARFTHGLRKAKLETLWDDALAAMLDRLLDPAVIATAVHRGIMRDPTLIVREPPTTPGKVEQVPVSPLDPATEAAGSGYTHERLRVEVGTTGLPPGLIEMLRLLNLGDVTEDDVKRAVSQSNLRNEYMDVVLALRRRLLTPNEYEEAALRGIIGRAEADDGAALSGMEKADAALLFETMGRPLTVHQLVTGLARGGTYGGTYDDIPEPYRDAVRRSNIRPEYARLAYANRYTFPSAFVLRGLAQAGDLGDAQAVETILLEIGWPPSLAAKVAPEWVGGTAKADPHVAKAENQLWTALHKSYVNGEADTATAQTALAQLGVTATAQTDVLGLWDAERALIRKQLTPAQIRKAYTKAETNPATGAQWTRDDAIARLVAQGMSTNDAITFVDQ